MGFTYCPLLMSVACPGHSEREKFQSCLSEVAYRYPDEEAGDVDVFGVWVGLMIQDEPIRVHLGDIDVRIPRGTFAVVTENNQGHIGFTTYDTADRAQEAFDQWMYAYELYCAGRDYDDYMITSSTGRIGS